MWKPCFAHLFSYKLRWVVRYCNSGTRLSMPIEAVVTKIAFINLAYAPIRLAILTGFAAAGVRLLQFIFLNKGGTECRKRRTFVRKTKAKRKWWGSWFYSSSSTHGCIIWVWQRENSSTWMDDPKRTYINVTGVLSYASSLPLLCFCVNNLL